MKQAGLHFVEYYKKGRELLRPGNWITDEELLGKIHDFDIVRQRHIAEIITGNLVFHEFYVSKMPNSTDTSRHVDEITYTPENIYLLISKKYFAVIILFIENKKVLCTNETLNRFACHAFFKLLFRALLRKLCFA